MRSANFVEETTVSIAGTGGNGDITLTALASTPRFSTVFGTQATTIRYVIEDTVGKRFETGLGTVASNVLTRTRPQITWDGTTYADNAPAALAFGSAPASGNVRVRLAALAENTGGFVMPGANSTVGGQNGFAASANFGWTGNGTGGGLTADQEYYSSYLLPVAGRLDGFGLDVTTAVAGNIKSALYACGSNGLPGQKIVDFGLLSTATTGVKQDTTPAGWTPAGAVWLAPGWYYIGFISSAASGLRGTQGNSQSHRTPLGRANGYGYSQTYSRSGGSYTTGLPAVPAPTAIIDPGGNPLGNPWLQLRVLA